MVPADGLDCNVRNVQKIRHTSITLKALESRQLQPKDNINTNVKSTATILSL